MFPTAQRLPAPPEDGKTAAIGKRVAVFRRTQPADDHLMVAAQHGPPPIGQKIEHLVVPGTVVDLITQQIDLIRRLLGQIGQHSLQGREVAVDIAQKCDSHQAVPKSGLARPDIRLASGRGEVGRKGPVNVKVRVIAVLIGPAVVVDDLRFCGHQLPVKELGDDAPFRHHAR